MIDRQALLNGTGSWPAVFRSARRILSDMDTTQAVTRLKDQAQKFSVVYKEFYRRKELAAHHPITWRRWMQLTEMSDYMYRTMSVMNRNFDTANDFSEAVFGSPLSSFMGGLLNGYIVSSIASLKFLTNALAEYNRYVPLIVETPEESHEKAK
jgi:hypothetical protein